MNKTRERIERLESGIASRIAAGEVIERPVSAAKELLENSLDAGADDIKINLEQGGKASLVIEDNGCGIERSELPLAIERYATSKIRTLDDLERVMTLGYRGEALSSIAAVSRVEIRSRAEGADTGALIRCEGGELITHTEIPAPFGTRVQVDDLFYNLPARRKFLRGATAELKRILQVVQDYAIACPEVRFRVSNEGRQLLDIGGESSTDDVLKSLWGSENRAVKSSSRSGDAQMTMWWNGIPGSRRVNVTLFVNGRRVQDPTVRSALNSTGASIYGEWVVMIELPPEDVDVNIHPAKAEVRFRRSGTVFELTRRAAQELLRLGGGFEERARDISAEPERTIDPWENYVPPAIFPTKKQGLFSSRPIQTEEREEYRAPSLFPPARSKPDRKYLGQVQGGYLVFDDPKGMCLLDAHAAHERILYEEIEDAFAGNSIPSQQLAFEQDIPSAIISDVIIHRETLSGMGFSFRLQDEQGSSDAFITAVPALQGIGRLSPIEMLRSAVRGIEEESDPSKRDREVWWRWARTACRDAIKLGDSLEAEEALDLFERLERCRSPYSCPHGRPTTIFVAGEKLRSWFER